MLFVKPCLEGSHVNCLTLHHPIPLYTWHYPNHHCSKTLSNLTFSLKGRLHSSKYMLRNIITDTQEVDSLDCTFVYVSVAEKVKCPRLEPQS